MESALNPLGPSNSEEEGADLSPWWARGEKPWQLLSACMEVQRALVSGKPEEFLSTLPVHQVGVEWWNGVGGRRALPSNFRNRAKGR